MSTRYNTTLRRILAATVLHLPIFAQTQVDLRTQSKSVDFTQASSTRPIKMGTVPSATCLPGELFLDMDAASGANLLVCVSLNSWALQGTALTLQSNGTSIGARPTQNLIAGFGLVNLLDDDGTRLNVQQHIDTSVVETRQGEQIGTTLLCASMGTSSSTYTCTMNPTLTQYTPGMVVRWVPDISNNAGPLTLNIDGLGARAVKLPDGVTDPSAPDVSAGTLLPLWYDGTSFRLMSPPSGAAATGATQPPCANGMRGRTWLDPGTDGVKDTITVCAKDATDTFAWRSVY